MTDITTTTTKRFAEFKLSPDVLAALTRMGIESPTPIQEVCIPAILEGRDVVGKAETGTGKTIGFGAPLVSHIDTNRVAVQALILTPTRELAQQVAGVLELLGAGRNLGVALVVGGVHASEQVLKLRSGSQVVVGTPGRVLDFLRERILSAVWCEVVVLDEADRMLDMGFIDDVTQILDKTPQERQTLLFSATVPPEIQKLLHHYMKNPAMFSTSQGLSTVAEIKQTYVEADFPLKFRALQKILDAHSDGTVLIFCNTRRQAIDLDRMLWGHGYSAGALHGDQEQDARFKILESFRRGEVKILVATDVASRGLDIEDIACVINYEVPEDAESYVHRIGRTGRAQKSGLAISIVSGKEWGDWQRILKQTGFPVERSGPERVRKGGGGRMEWKEAGGRARGGRGRPRRGGRQGEFRSASAQEGRGEGTDGGRRRRRRGGRGRGERQGQAAPLEPGSPGGRTGGERMDLSPRSPKADVLAAVSEKNETAVPGPEKEIEGVGPLTAGADRPRRERPPRKKLEDLDDSFLKVDYFDVDPSLLRDAPKGGHGGEPAQRKGSERTGKESGRRHGPPHGRSPGHAHGQSQDRGQGSSHGSSHGHGHKPAHAEAGSAHPGGEGVSGVGPGEASAGGQRRRRRRRRGGRGRGRAGEG